MLNRTKETMVPAKIRRSGTARIKSRRIHTNRQDYDHECYECDDPIFHGCDYFYEVWRIEWTEQGRYKSQLEYRRRHCHCPEKDREARQW